MTSNIIKSIVGVTTGGGGDIAGLKEAFKSEASRDLYFAITENLLTLTTDQPIVVRNGVSSEVQYWTGANNPVAYDPDFWMVSALNAGAGSLILGEDGSSISSGARVLNVIDAFDAASIPAFLEYDSGGSGVVRTFSLGANSTVPVNTISGTPLADPQDLAFPANIADTLSTAFEVIPAASGILRVQTWQGVDDTGPVLVDNLFGISVGDIGVVIKLTLPNPLMLYIGDSTFTRFSGVALEGGVQTTGPFIGLTKPFLNSDIHVATKTSLITEAPEDSQNYVRNNAAWVVAPSGGGNQLDNFNANDALFPSSNPAVGTSRNGHPILAFGFTVNESVNFASVMSNDYSPGNITVDIDWVSDETDDSCVWGIQFERNAPGGNNINSDSFATQQTVTTTTSGTAGVIARSSIVLTQAQADAIAAGDSYRLRLERLKTDGADDLSTNAEVVNVIVRQ